MAKFKERKLAVELRKEGKSYSQIKNTLGVSKSSLSLWLRDYPLPESQLRLLRDWNEVRIEKYRATRKQTRENRLNEFYRYGKKRLFPVSNKSLYIAGLFLYWGEGTKARDQALIISNTDPAMIKFSLFWMTKILKIPKKTIRIRLHLYKDMDIGKEHYFWQKQLGIPRIQFGKPYIKKSSSGAINHSGFKHGTCQIRGGNVRLKEKITMETKVIYDKYKMGV